MTNAEVVCVDGVDGVEAVVIRHSRTGRLSAVNASAFLAMRRFDVGRDSRTKTGKGRRDPQFTSTHKRKTIPI